MNPALTSALDDALQKLGGRLPTDWRQIIMVKNDGPIPVPPHPVTGDAARGFNLLLLSPKGRPAYYIRCRDSGDAMAIREADILQRLCESPAIREHLPDSAGARSDGIQVLATRYMRGRLFTQLLRDMSQQEWRDAVLELTELVTKIGHVALAIIPGLANPEPFDFWREGEESLARLPLSSGQTAAAAAALRAAGTVPRFPQHGDLWPANAVRDGDTWRLLDFDLFGRVEAPLFDACHLTYSSTEYLISGGHGLDTRWVELLTGDGVLGSGGREILGRSALARGLSADQALGAFLYYLVEGTARLMRKGARTQVWRGPLAETATAADLLRRGIDLRQILFPGMPRD